MELVVEAEKAEDIGAAFSKFKEALPDQATEITALISELWAISSALRDLHTAIQSREYGRNIHYIADDLRVVRTSVSYTLKDVFDIIGDINSNSRGNLPTIGAYRQTWKDIYLHFRKESPSSLCIRLETYRTFIMELGSIMKRNGPDPRIIDDMRESIEDLLDVQDRRLAEEFGGMSLGRQGPTPRRSYERTRQPSSPQSPQSPRDDIPPFAPDVPSSPTTTSSTAQSTSTNLSFHHWAMRVFTGEVQASPLPRSGDISKCYGPSMPDAGERLGEEYDELLQLAFGGGSEMVVRLYIRDRDHRARILCKSPRPSGSSTYCCLPLNCLEIHQAESSLQLCRRSRSPELELWANLKFTTIERMVLFFCMFLALRSQDSGKEIEDIQDHELAGEKEIFAGQIVDDHFLHALRIFRDRSSKAVRLQASIMRGDMNRTPVWTAFITHSIGSSTWLRKATPKLIHLGDLRRHVFSDDYTPQRTARGEHVLNFTTAADAAEFIDTIKDLATPARRR